MQDHTVTVAVAVMARAIGGMTTGSPLEAPAGSDEGRLVTPAHVAGHAYFTVVQSICAAASCVKNPVHLLLQYQPAVTPAHGMSQPSVTRKSDFCPRAIVPLPEPL